MIDITALRADVFNPLESDLDYFIRRRRALSVCDIAPGPDEEDDDDDLDGPDEDGERLSNDVDEETEEETTEADQDEMCERAARKYEADRTKDPRQ